MYHRGRQQPIKRFQPGHSTQPASPESPLLRTRPTTLPTPQDVRARSWYKARSRGWSWLIPLWRRGDGPSARWPAVARPPTMMNHSRTALSDTLCNAAPCNPPRAPLVALCPGCAGPPPPWGGFNGDLCIKGLPQSPPPPPRGGEVGGYKGALEGHWYQEGTPQGQRGCIRSARAILGLSWVVGGAVLPRSVRCWWSWRFPAALWTEAMLRCQQCALDKAVSLVSRCMQACLAQYGRQWPTAATVACYSLVLSGENLPNH